MALLRTTIQGHHATRASVYSADDLQRHLLISDVLQRKRTQHAGDVAPDQVFAASERLWAIPTRRQAPGKTRSARALHYTA